MIQSDRKKTNLIQKAINRESNTLYNPTTEDIVEVVLVSVTDENYKSPESFNDVWYNKISHLQHKWREVTKKEFINREKIIYGEHK